MIIKKRLVKKYGLLEVHVGMRKKQFVHGENNLNTVEKRDTISLIEVYV